MPSAKSRQMQAIRADRIHECFEHETQGWYDVTAMRRAARNLRYGGPVSIELRPEYVRRFMTCRDYELERIWELLVDPSAPWRDDPALALYNKRDDTHTFIDGTHRVLARWILKEKNFPCWVVPIERAIRPRQDMVMLSEWGQPGYVQQRRQQSS